jgi:NADH-quinone oxidoreductase subunit C
VTPETTIEKMTAALGSAVLKAEAKGKEVLLHLEPAQIMTACQHLKNMGYDYLLLISSVDWKDRFELVYHITAVQQPLPPVALKVTLPRENPVIDSVTSIWATANWNEREAYDLMGIKFNNHPDLRRILLPDDWVGHPLRKDYQREGVIPMPDLTPPKPAAPAAPAGEAKPKAEEPSI